MKMEHTLTASGAGTVGELRASAGQRVRDGDLLLRIGEKQKPKLV
jgi:biotin carboxyl carrier protein